VNGVILRPKVDAVVIVLIKLLPHADGASLVGWGNGGLNVRAGRGYQGK
jgi:hypothetical protein